MRKLILAYLLVVSLLCGIAYAGGKTIYADYIKTDSVTFGTTSTDAKTIVFNVSAGDKTYLTSPHNSPTLAVKDQVGDYRTFQTGNLHIFDDGGTTYRTIIGSVSTATVIAGVNDVVVLDDVYGAGGGPNRLLVPHDGTLASPSIALGSVSGHGLYKRASGEIGISAGGVLVASWSSGFTINWGAVVNAGVTQLANGTLAAPGLRFATSATDGIASVSTALNLAHDNGEVSLNSDVAGECNLTMGDTLRMVSAGGTATLSASGTQLSTAGVLNLTAVSSDAQVRIGGNVMSVGYEGQQTVDCFGIQVDSTSNTMLVQTKGSTGDWGLAAQPSPTIYVHGPTAPTSGTREYTAIATCTTASLIRSGLGVTAFNDIDGYGAGAVQALAFSFVGDETDGLFITGGNPVLRHGGVNTFRVTNSGAGYYDDKSLQFGTNTDVLEQGELHSGIVDNTLTTILTCNTGTGDYAFVTIDYGLHFAAGGEVCSENGRVQLMIVNDATSGRGAGTPGVTVVQYNTSGESLSSTWSVDTSADGVLIQLTSDATMDGGSPGTGTLRWKATFSGDVTMTVAGS